MKEFFFWLSMAPLLPLGIMLGFTAWAVSKAGFNGLFFIALMAGLMFACVICSMIHTAMEENG